MKNASHKEKRIRRHRRIRARVYGTASRPRLSVFRSNRFLQAQLIDDEKGKTLIGITDAALKAKGAKVDHARLLGETVAKRAKEIGITNVVFDRGGYRYHGRVKAFADAVRNGGVTI